MDQAPSTVAKVASLATVHVDSTLCLYHLVSLPMDDVVKSTAATRSARAAGTVTVDRSMGM